MRQVLQRLQGDVTLPFAQQYEASHAGEKFAQSLNALLAITGHSCRVIGKVG